jgi:hypothetical protein
MIEAVNRIVGQVERREYFCSGNGALGRSAGKRGSGLPAPERCRQVAYATPLLSACVYCSPRALRRPDRAVVERAVLEEQHDDVIDGARVPSPGSIRGSSDGARGQHEADERHGDEPWTATPHAVF